MSELLYPRTYQCWYHAKLIAQAHVTIQLSIKKLRETEQLVDPYRLSPYLTKNAVAMEWTERGWRVTVSEYGVGTVARTFRDRLSAFNFAESNVMRLGLDKMTASGRQ
ncbi:hypothetical protein [Mesorhizobium sp. LCM 4577]|uniref:hypothetical protein n=1 Tax=Mesorhizobium sp. LCM 4577 TaxID=1848288 RepID=UPI0010424829|nr:hypothetical protein [Mesorhizobium sp. LCM 4577]